jgi:hypothetical protein
MATLLDNDNENQGGTRKMVLSSFVLIRFDILVRRRVLRLLISRKEFKTSAAISFVNASQY